MYSREKKMDGWIDRKFTVLIDNTTGVLNLLKDSKQTQKQQKCSLTPFITSSSRPYIHTHWTQISPVPFGLIFSPAITFIIGQHTHSITILISIRPRVPDRQAV